MTSYCVYWRKKFSSLREWALAAVFPNLSRPTFLQLWSFKVCCTILMHKSRRSPDVEVQKLSKGQSECQQQNPRCEISYLFENYHLPFNFRLRIMECVRWWKHAYIMTRNQGNASTSKSVGTYRKGRFSGERHPTDPFPDFGASKIGLRRSWITWKSPISWSWSRL